MIPIKNRSRRTPTIRAAVHGLLAAGLCLGLAGAGQAGPLERGVEAYEGGHFNRAVAQLLPLASDGNARAQYLLGVMYDEGEGVPHSDEQAVYWLKRSAQQEQARAQYRLAEMLAEGRGAHRDFAGAYMWAARAAEQGLAPAGELRDRVAGELSQQEREQLRARMR